jgi:hypothetical protein
MSYSVSVTSSLHDLKMSDSGKDDIDPTNIEGDTYFYFSEAVASSTDMYDFWIKPARSLGLRWLGRLSDSGLYLNKKEDIDELISEVNTLESHWRQNTPNEMFYGKTRLEWLSERAANVKLAAQLAKEKQATLSIA